MHLDGDGCPRGQCTNCDCQEWLGPGPGGAEAGRHFDASLQRAFNATNVLNSHIEAPGDAAAARRYACTSTLGGGNAELLLEPRKCCWRCGCDPHWHRDLSAQVAKISNAGALVEVEAGWDDLERSLYLWTAGDFCLRREDRRQRCRSKRGKDEQPGPPGEVSVTVICPTSSSRRSFHPNLYGNFCRQSHAAKELVVVETGGDEPSDFFSSGPPAEDPRVLYRHFPVRERAWSIGAKRNVACHLAAGDVVAHFDDDDIYAPGYLAWMLEALLPAGAASTAAGSGNRGAEEVTCRGYAAEAVTLARWHTFELETGSLGLCDVEAETTAEDWERLNWTYGFGFTYVYPWEAWRARWFRDDNLGEDSGFIEALLARGGRLAVLKDEQGLCAHTLHDANVSGIQGRGSEARSPLPPHAAAHQRLDGLARELRQQVSAAPST